MHVARRPWRRRLLAAAAGSVAALAVAEITLRIAGLPDTSRLFLSAEAFAPDSFVADPECFWRLSARHPEANAHGLRGPWWEPEKTAGELRVLAVGDSCTFGWGVDWEHTWAVRLERLLQAALPDRVVRSALLALPGHSTFQNERMLRRLLPAAAPDVVVFYCGAWNDYVPAAGADDATLAARLATSRLWALLQGALAPDLGELRAAFARGEAPFGRRVPPERFAALLHDMVGACRARGAEVLLVAPAHPAKTTAEHPGLREYRERVAALARQLAVPCVDLAGVCARLDPDGAPPLPGHATACFLDWVHPNATLHAALAAALADHLLPARGARGEHGAELPSPRLAVRDGCVSVPWDGGAEAPLRSWLGDRPARAAIRGTVLRVDVPEHLAPGTHALQVVTRTGARSLGHVAVPGLPLAAGARDGEAPGITFSGTGPPGRVVWLWLAPGRAPLATATPFGGFGLLVPGVIERAGAVRFDLAATGRHTALTGADGTWTIAVSGDHAAPWPARALFAQALVVDPATHRGALTEVVELAPR